MPFTHKTIGRLSPHLCMIEDAPDRREVSALNSDEIVKSIDNHLDTYWTLWTESVQPLLTDLILQRQATQADLTLFLGRFDAQGNAADVIPPESLIKRMLLYYDRIIIPDPLTRMYDLIHGVGIRIAPWGEDEVRQIQNEYVEKVTFMRALLPLIKSGVVLPLPYNFLVPHEPAGDHLDYLTRENIHLLKYGYPAIFQNRDSLLTAREYSPGDLASLLGADPKDLEDEEAIGVGFIAEGTEELFFKEGGDTVQRNTSVHIERVSRRHGNWPQYLATYCLFERLMNILTETQLSFFLGARFFTESPTSWQLINQMAEGLPQVLHFLKKTRSRSFAEVRKQMRRFDLLPTGSLFRKESRPGALAQSASDFTLTTLDFPYLEGVGFSEIVSLRDDDAFGRCRDALRRLNRRSDIGVPLAPSPDDLKDIVDHEIRPEFHRLDRITKNLRDRCFQSAALLIASLVIGATAGPIGLIPFGIPAALQMAANVGDAIETRKLLKEHDLYFLWKIHKGNKP